MSPFRKIKKSKSFIKLIRGFKRYVLFPIETLIKFTFNLYFSKVRNITFYKIYATSFRTGRGIRSGEGKAGSEAFRFLDLGILGPESCSDLSAKGGWFFHLIA